MNSTIKANEYLDQFVDGDDCPKHGTPHRKVYTYGSTMSGETEVCTFRGCGCAVSISHDPVGGPSSAQYHETFDHAAGRGRLHAMMMAAKYR